GGDLSRYAGEQVQADDGDEERAGLREPARVEVADEARREHVGEQHEDGHGEPGGDPGRATAHQTRCPSGARPKRPAGRTSSTPRITATATGSARPPPTP